MAEKDFQTELGRGLAAAGYYYKIPDQPVSQMTRARFTEAKPFDCWWVLAGLAVALELKQVRGLSLNIGDKGQLRAHQEDNLLCVETQGGVGLVAVNFQHRLPPSRAKQLGFDLVDRAFVARIGRLVEARTELATDTIPLEWFARSGVELALTRRNGLRVWDVAPLVDQLCGRAMVVAN